MMSEFYSCIYVDDKNSIWKFSLNANQELYYNIKYGEGKWTEIKVLDKDVLSFAVNVEKNGKIHIVYSNIKGEIKYCTLDDRKWIGRILYRMESNEFEIYNINVEIIDMQMHIFYLLIENNDSHHGALVHSVWNGKETKTVKLKDIIVVPTVKENYKVRVDHKDDIDLIFISDEGDEVSLNYYNYQNEKWKPAIKLYHIQGDEISFEMLNDLDNIHILNKYREDSKYILDDVVVKIDGEIKKNRVYESTKVLSEPLLFKVRNKLCACWLEENKIYYSILSSNQWSRPIYFNRENDLKVERYHFSIAFDKEMIMKAEEIYGTGDTDLNLFFPSHFVSETLKGEGIIKKAQVAENISELPQKIETFEKLKLQMYRVKQENKQLKKALNSLKMLVDKNQRFLDASKEKIIKILEQKQKSEENCDLLMDLHQKMQKKIDSFNHQMSDEKDYITKVEDRLKEFQENNTNLKQQMEQLIEEKNNLIEEKDGIIIEKNDLMEEKNQLIEEKNNLILERDQLIEEKNKLAKDLETEKNKSFVERIIKG